LELDLFGKLVMVTMLVLVEAFDLH
jgi:hypothetical protein